MRFSEYKTSRDCDEKIEICASLMERFGVDADAFIDDFIGDSQLDEGLKQFWQGTKDFFRGAWDSAKQKMMDTPDQSIWHAGAKNVINRSRKRSGQASVGGSDTYTKAKQSLQALRDFLASNDKAKNVTSANRGNVSVADYIGQLLQSLERETGAALLSQGKDVASSGPGDSQQQVGATAAAGTYQGQGAIDPNNLPPNMQPQAQQQTNVAPVKPKNNKNTKRNAKKTGSTSPPQNTGSQQQVSSGGGQGGTWYA